MELAGNYDVTDDGCDGCEGCVKDGCVPHDQGGAVWKEMDGWMEGGKYWSTWLYAVALCP